MDETTRALPPDINPYAPPSVFDSVARPDPGVGVWRDGHLLVMHRDAVLPPLCVKSGRPATEWIDLRLGFLYRIRWGEHYPVFRIPLSARSAWLRVYGTRIALAVTIIAIVLIYFTEDPAPWHGDSPINFYTVVASVTFFVAALQAMFLGTLVNICRVQRDYFWFTGAHRKFLAQLPPWPGL